MLRLKIDDDRGAMKLQRWLLLLVVCATGAGCSIAGPPSTPDTGSPPPRRDQWPPIVTAGPAPGVTIALHDRTAVLTNGSSRTYWLSPPVIELWEGGAPWVETTDPGSGQVELEPGDKVELVVEPRPDTVRVGARLWQSATPGPDESPWFVWLEIESTP